MKKMKCLASLMMLVVAATMFSACGDDNSGDDTSGTDEYVNATVNGTAFSSEIVAATYGGIDYNISGTQSSTKVIYLTLPSGFTVGTHAITAPSNVYQSGYYKIGYAANINVSITPVLLTSGTITVTSYDATTKEISGSFEGTASNLTVVSGTFRSQFHTSN